VAGRAPTGRDLPAGQGLVADEGLVVRPELVHRLSGDALELRRVQGRSSALMLWLIRYPKSGFWVSGRTRKNATRGTRSIG